jgi:hypothetical protein
VVESASVDVATAAVVSVIGAPRFDAVCPTATLGVRPVALLSAPCHCTDSRSETGADIPHGISTRELCTVQPTPVLAVIAEETLRYGDHRDVGRIADARR